MQLFIYILECFIVSVILVLTWFSLFQIAFSLMESFSQFWKLLFYKVSRKIPENLPNFFICKISQRGTWESSRGPTMPPHLGQARPSPGRAQAWCGAPSLPLTPLPLSLSLSSSHPRNTIQFFKTRVLTATSPEFRSLCSNPHLF